jgi:serine/threonine protein kinase
VSPHTALAVEFFDACSDDGTGVGETAKLHLDLEALVGSTIHGRYAVESLLGVGGMGAVFKGRHTGLQRGVAIKVLHPEIGRDPAVSKRFDREAQSASRLDHPNCVRVTDFGTTENGTKYLVMELLEGDELDSRLGQPWPPDRAVATIEQVLRGLEHAHYVGIVHRDLKPENIFVTRDFHGEEVIKIVDFGIAKLIDEQGSEKLTRQGIVFGTPRYMAPEQAAGGKIDERTDLYAVGLIFYELLAGQPPFHAEEAAQLLRMQIMAPPPPLPASVPTPLAKVVEKLIEKSKSDRYASAREVLDALAQAKASLVAPAIQPVPVPVLVAVVSSPPPSSSGVAWQPAPSPSPAISGVTLAASAVELSGVSISASMRTGSHAYVGQEATGPFPSVATGPQTTIADGHASASVSGVAAQPAAPHHARRWLPIVLAGATLLLVLSGVGVLFASSLAEDDEPDPAGDPSTTAVARDAPPTDTTTAPDSNTETHSGTAVAPGPIRDPQSTSSRSVRPTSKPGSKSADSRSTSDTNKKSGGEPSDPSGGGSDSTSPKPGPQGPITDPTRDPTGGGTDSNQSDGGSEPPAEQQKPEPEENEAPQGETTDREQGRGQEKGKGHDKKKPI